MALEFAPLYWIYHDGWNYKETKTLTVDDATEDASKEFHHAGHVHLFLMDVNPTTITSSQSYWGEQVYNFTVEDTWGPNSTDPNRNQSVRLIGKPVWYFYIEEYWRRMYIQPWEYVNKTIKNGVHDGLGGIKYDASKPQHTLGPFREGGEFYFFNTVVNRTMPVEYWKEKTKHTRDYYIKKGDDHTTGGGTWTFDKILFQWVYDTHHEPDSFGPNNPVKQHRLRDLNTDHLHYFHGTNAKRLRKDGNNDSPENTIYDWNIGPWQGWYEYKEVVSYDGDYYIRDWRPQYYDKDNLDATKQPCYSAEKRMAFPNPPPYPISESDMRWEYLHYFDKVRGGNGGSSDNWEQRKDDWQAEYGFDEWTEEQEDACFTTYLSELGYDFFELFMLPEPDGNGVVTILDENKPTYITYGDFKKIWRKLTTEEIIALNIPGDYPVKNDAPLPDVQDSAFYPSEDDTPISTTEPLDPYRNTTVNPYDRYKEFFDKVERFTIPHDTTALGDMGMTYPKDSPNSPYPHPRESSYTYEDGARTLYPDDGYLSPVIEYQKVVHCNWTRLPNMLDDDGYFQSYWRTADGNFGDGFNVAVTIPFKKNGEIQSPFSGSDKKCSPIGVYHHDVVKAEDKMRYHVEWHNSIEQLRKYDFIEYVKFIRDFQVLHPTYEEDFNDGTNASWNKTDLTDGQVWKTKLDAFFQQQDATKKWSEKSVVRRDDENQFDSETGLWREALTQTAVTAEQVATPHYVDSQGNTRKGGNIAVFNQPYAGDGKWTEQCLGAIVKAKVVLVLEDALGYRWQETVESTQLVSDTQLKGNDYGD